MAATAPDPFDHVKRKKRKKRIHNLSSEHQIR